MPRRRRQTALRVLLALTILAVSTLLGLWIARVPIATGFIDRTFAAKNVPARYAITDLGFGRQRLTNVVIGDPRDPDLVADWIETYTDVGVGGAAVTGVRAGRVRMRGRLIGGRVSLGAIDRLLPPPSGAPFTLPAIDLVVDDARMRLATPFGTVGLRLAGRGRLNDGFRGTLAAVGQSVAVGDCALTRPTAVLDLSVRDAAPKIAGPVRLAALACGGVTVANPESRIDVALGPALDRWQGSAGVRAGPVSAGAVQLGALVGQIGFSGTAARTEGDAQLRGDGLRHAGLTGETLAFAGTWRVAGAHALAAGRVDARAVALSPAMRRAVARSGAAGAGTPLGPLAAAAAQATTRAAERFDIGGEVAIGTALGRPLVTVRQIAARSASGASIGFGEGAGVVLGERGGMRADGTLTFGGGGLPTGRVALAQRRAGGTVSGTATIAPYTADGARLALTPARFELAPDGALRLTTVAELSGPLGDGSVDRLRLPLVARRSATGAILVNEACTPAGFQRLSVAGLALNGTRLRLCPVDGALVRFAGGAIGGGMRIAASRLAGTLGGTPLALAAGSAEWRHARASFVLADVAARLGRGERVTRLDLARLDGRVAGGGVAGEFGGGAGQIGNVPLLLSGAAGDWRLAGGVLSLGGAMAVADAAAAPRFRQLAARDVSLRLANGAIMAQGALFEPAKSVKIADVTIRHRLASGSGAAHLAVPGITFGDGFQPEELTRLTFGVIADVNGTVRGVGDIAWSPDGVTSTGTFGTDDVDLAAAFGPVTGIKGEIRFTDLLALESAPNQVATVASVNPGVEVTDGRIDYQLLRDLRIKVNGGRWPFAGGTLTLRPTLLDFAAAQERRMTFDVAGMEARQFLQQFDFKNLDATGIFDGQLPMIFDQSGGRIENGRLTVREGGGSLAYLGELTEKDLGIWGNIAFQALRSLRYRNLDIVMNGPLAGEMITEVRFAGVSQGEGAKSNFLVRRLQKLPFVFNIRIKAPFRGLIDSAASFYDPKRLIERNLPALLEEQEKRAQPPATLPPATPPPSIQPPASRIMP
jgi:hypothetical protein